MSRRSLLNTCSKKELEILAISFGPFAFLSCLYSGVFVLVSVGYSGKQAGIRVKQMWCQNPANHLSLVEPWASYFPPGSDSSIVE